MSSIEIISTVFFFLGIHTQHVRFQLRVKKSAWVVQVSKIRSTRVAISRPSREV